MSSFVKNILKRPMQFYRGEVGVKEAFWFWGFFVNFAYLYIISYIDQSFAPIEEVTADAHIPYPVSAAVLMVVSLFYVPFSVNGWRRCARKSKSIWVKVGWLIVLFLLTSIGFIWLMGFAYSEESRLAVIFGFVLYPAFWYYFDYAPTHNKSA